MDADSWAARFSASKRHQSGLQIRSGADLQLTFDDFDGEEDLRAEFPCPFCSEDFDIVGLCCHIDDEHSIEAKNAVCPVCGTRVGMDMVGHITMQHGHFFKMQRRRRYRKGSHSTLSILSRELREGHLQSLFAGSSCPVASSNTAPDPLLSSFISSMPIVDVLTKAKSDSPAEGTSDKQIIDKKEAERGEPALPDEEQEERARRCSFVQELLLSTIFEDTL
ncbi:protein DEHYDRATION-INDUCED 19 homolog 2-like [Nymphaea colorata]|nr:protein DEHYDRATION-INDUCED 19 homolog 2-like [Nymphaea colorata]